MARGKCDVDPAIGSSRVAVALTPGVLPAFASRAAALIRDRLGQVREPRRRPTRHCRPAVDASGRDTARQNRCGSGSATPQASGSSPTTPARPCAGRSSASCRRRWSVAGLAPGEGLSVDRRGAGPKGYRGRRGGDESRAGREPTGDLAEQTRSSLRGSDRKHYLEIDHGIRISVGLRPGARSVRPSGGGLCGDAGRPHIARVRSRGLRFDADRSSIGTGRGKPRPGGQLHRPCQADVLRLRSNQGHL